MKKDSNSLLTKKIKDLTLADFAKLEKPLGTSSSPFPMWGPMRVEHGNTSSIETLLSVIADDAHPLRVYSERSYDEVVALAFCDMPVPSMLPLFKDGLERRGDPLQRQRDLLEGKQPQNENFNRTQMMIGDPGHGKSFLGALQGRLRNKGAVEIYDCGGKNMNDLLFEMVLDFGAGDALPQAIDKRLKAGTLEPLSQGLLGALPDKYVSKEDGVVVSIDWNGLKTAGTAEVQSAFETLKKVSEVEGLDKGGGNALGMNSTYGALIRAYLENREIVLDEYNKSREGSDNALQTVIQFMIGEIRDTTVENPLKNKDNTSGPSSFTFRREDMGAGFFVTFTGNRTEDGITTRSLNKSVYDRLKPDTLPDPEVIDWQHRICQMMVGMPVSTLYETFQEQADQDPTGFGDWLLALRRKKAEIEGSPVPELQETLLSNWKNVVDASEKLAKFYDRWASMTDANKITSNGNTDLIDEVDEEYSKKEAMSFRRIKQHLEESIPLRARMELPDAPVKIDFKNWAKEPKRGEAVEENASLNFGSRLVEYIERMVYEKSGAQGKKKLYSKLLKSMEEFGLRDISLQEAARSKQKSVEESLNISAFADRDMNKQASMARKVFCDYLRETNPEIKATDDQIITPKKFLDALQYVAARDTAATNELFVANRDPETVHAGQPISSALIKDVAVYTAEGKDEIDFGVTDLVHHDDLLASLGLPTIGAKNLAAVWDRNTLLPLKKAGEAAANNDTPAAPAVPGGASVPDHDEGLYIAENRSSLGLAATTVQVYYKDKDGERPVSVHIVRNNNRNKTLVISEKAPSKLLAAFKEAGVVHVDRNDPAAATKVDSALTELTRGMPAHARERLTQAFKYRNDVEADKPQNLPDLLVDASIDMLNAKYVVKNAPKAKKAARR